MNFIYKIIFYIANVNVHFSKDLNREVIKERNKDMCFRQECSTIVEYYKPDKAGLLGYFLKSTPADYVN